MKPYSLIGVDGNAYSIMGYTARAMRRAGMPKEEIDKMHSEATSGNYYHLIAVCDEYIDKVNEALGLYEEDFDELAEETVDSIVNAKIDKPYSKNPLDDLDEEDDDDEY